MSVCPVGAVTFESLDLETPFLVRNYMYILSMSSSWWSIYQGHRGKVIRAPECQKLKMEQLALKGLTVTGWYHIVTFTVQQTWSSRDLSLGLETSRDPFLQVLVSVLVLKPQSLGLGLGLETSESWSRSWS